MGTELLFKWGARTYLATVTLVGKLVSAGTPMGVETHWMPWIHHKYDLFKDSDPPEAEPG